MPNYIARLVSTLSGKLIASPGSDNAAQIIQEDPNNEDNQLWTFIDLGTGWWNIQSRLSQLYLNVNQGSHSAGANIIQWNVPSDDGSQWGVIYVTGDGSIVKIKSRLSGYVLNVDGGSLNSGARIIVWYDSGDAGNVWQRVLV